MDASEKLSLVEFVRIEDLYNALIHLAQSLNQNQRFDTFKNAMNISESLYNPVNILKRIDYNYGSATTVKFISKEQIDILKAENIKKIKIWAKNGKLLKTKNSLFIIQEWAEWAGKDNTLEMFMNNLNPEDILILTLDSLNKGGFLNNPHDEFIVATVNIIDLKVLKSKLKNINTSNMDENQEFLIQDVIKNLNALLIHDVQAWYKLGLNFKILQRYNEALEAFDKVLKIKPDDVDALYNKAVIFRILGKNQEALKFYQCVLDINPDYRKALLDKGKLLQKIGKVTEASEYLERARKLTKRNKS